jgi:hypothetical protein
VNRSRRFIIAVGTVTALSACGGTHSRTIQPSAGLTRSERAWVSGYASALRSGRENPRWSVCRTLAALSQSAPTARLRRLSHQRLVGCHEHRYRAAVARRHFIPTRFLTLARDLPRAVGPRRASYVDETLTAAAEEVTPRLKQIRCWSMSDWRRVERELSAMEDPDFPRALDGLVWYDHRDEIQLPVRTCASILRVRDQPDDELLRFIGAFALTTAGHELAHVLGANEVAAACQQRVLATRLAEALHVISRAMRDELSRVPRSSDAQGSHCRYDTGSSGRPNATISRRPRR